MTDTQYYVMNCPACGKQMKKFFIEDANVNVDICTEGCGGIFFDNRELEKFDEQHENAEEIFKELEGKEFAPQNEQEVRICPICDVPMSKLGGKDSVQIDVCNVCGGKFLDHGELEKIREATGKEYKESEKDKAIFNALEEESQKEILGPMGVFINQYFPQTGLRKFVENIVRKSI